MTFDEDVNPMLIEHLRQRAAFGEAKYGIPLRTFDSRNTITDALEEALDTAVYLTKLRHEWGEIAGLLEEAMEFVEEFGAPETPLLIELRETAARMRKDVARIEPKPVEADSYLPPTPPAWHPLRDCTCGLWAERENLGVVDHAASCPREATS